MAAHHAWGTGSWRCLKYLHPDGVDVMNETLVRSPIDISCYSGGRFMAEQMQHVNSGASTLIDSRHLYDDANQLHYAVDFAPWVDGKLSWKPEHYALIMPVLFEVAADFDVPVRWGGFWKSLVDMPHIELPRQFYPKNSPVSTHDARRRAGVEWKVDRRNGRYIRTKLLHPRPVPA